MDLAFTICMATFRNGQKIVGSTITQPERLATDQLRLKVTAAVVWYEGDRGRILKWSSVRPLALQETRTIGSIPTACALRAVCDRHAAASQIKFLTCILPSL